MSKQIDPNITASAVNKLSQKRSEIDALAETADGRAAKAFAEKNEAAIKLAIERGDTNELGKLISSFLQTESGNRIAESLNNIIK